MQYVPCPFWTESPRGHSHALNAWRKTKATPQGGCSLRGALSLRKPPCDGADSLALIEAQHGLGGGGGGDTLMAEKGAHVTLLEESRAFEKRSMGLSNLYS